MDLKNLLLAAALLLPGRAFCEEWVIPRTTYYITAEQQRMPDFPPPPKAGSPEDLKDLALVMDWQVRRSGEDCAQANAAAHANYDTFFAGVSPFPHPLPSTAFAILARIKTETDGVAADIKEKFRRERPFLRDPELDPCLGRIGGLAYPSGHATISRVFAHVLAGLVSSDREVFFARADKAALERVIGGVHHPSDIEAGKELADRLYGKYMKSKVFRRDMKRLRKMVKKRRRVKAAPGRKDGR